MKNKISIAALQSRYQITEEYNKNYKKEIKQTNKVWKYSIGRGKIQQVLIPKPFSELEKAVIEKMLKDREEYLVEKLVRKISLKLAEEKIEKEELGEIEEIIELLDDKKIEYEDKKKEKRRISWLEKESEKLKEIIFKTQRKLAKIESKMSKKNQTF